MMHFHNTIFSLYFGHFWVYFSLFWVYFSYLDYFEYYYFIL